MSNEEGINTIKSTHRKIIIAIHDKWRDGSPFAPHEVVEAADVSTSSVVRALKLLVKVGLVKHSERGFNGRHYTVSKGWPLVDVHEALQVFEYAKILKV